MLASFEFTLEYQKGANNEVADALSWVPIHHNCEIRATDRGEAEASEELLCEHVHLENEVHVQVAKLAPMHVLNWREVQEVDVVLVIYRRWLHTHKDTPFPRRDALGDNMNTEGCALFCMCNSLILSKELLYVSTMPKGEAEGILAFVAPTGQCWTALNDVHHDGGDQDQQRTLVLVAHDGG